MRPAGVLGVPAGVASAGSREGSRPLRDLCVLLASDPPPGDVARALSSEVLAPGESLGVILGSVDRASAQVLVLAASGCLGMVPAGTGVSTSAPWLAGVHGLEAVWVGLADAPVVCPNLAALLEAGAASLPDGGPDVGLAVLPLAYAGSPVGVLAAVLSGPPSGSWFESERLTALLDVLAVWTASLTSVSAVGVPRRAAGSRPRPAVLSDRQRAIVELVGDGLTNAQVAARVGFSESTVKQEVSALCEAFGASGRRDLARLVFLAGV